MVTELVQNCAPLDNETSRQSTVGFVFTDSLPTTVIMPATGTIDRTAVLFHQSVCSANRACRLGCQYYSLLSPVVAAILYGADFC